jgi:hypothetical protein
MQHIPLAQEVNKLLRGAGAESILWLGFEVKNWEKSCAELRKIATGLGTRI